jgi:short-subunit dehydrogenase
MQTQEAMQGKGDDAMTIKQYEPIYELNPLRKELREKGIHLVEVYPGLINTEFHEKAGRRISRGTPPRKVAEAIIKAVEKKKKVVYIPKYLALLRLIGPHLPLI